MLWARICDSASDRYSTDDTTVRRGDRLKLLERRVYKNRRGRRLVRVELLERADGGIVQGFIDMADTSFAFAYNRRSGTLGDDFITHGPEDQGIVVDEHGDAIYGGDRAPEDYLGRVAQWDRLRLVEPRPILHPRYDGIEMIKVEVVEAEHKAMVGTTGWVEVCATSFSARLAPLSPVRSPPRPTPPRGTLARFKNAVLRAMPRPVRRRVRRWLG